MTLRKKVYSLLEVDQKAYSISWYVDLALLILIALNIVALVLETVESLYIPYRSFFATFELFSIIIFSIEYVLRLWSIVEKEGYSDPVWGRVRAVGSPLLLIDLLAILPFYLAFLPVDLRFIRILRLLRLFRLFKFLRYTVALDFILDVIGKKKEQLVISIVFALFLLLFISSIMYYIEHDAQPSGFSSIPETMWWGVATLTTVGYGDVYPITPIGKFLGGVISILGIGVFALPAGILASGFSDAVHGKSVTEHIKKCPNCGTEVEMD